MAIELKKIPLFRNLSPLELVDVKKQLREKDFSKGEILFYEGNPCEKVFIVETGRVKVFRMAASGKEQTLETLGPGDTCACNPGSCQWHCGSSAQALTDAHVWFIPRDVYAKLAQKSSNFSHSLNELFARRLNKFSALIEEVSLKDVKKRLVKFLLDMQGAELKPGPKAELLIPFTREEIAQRLGTSRETVARYLYQLKRSRLIDIKPHKILLTDPEGLKKLIS